MHTLIIVPGKISNTRSFDLDHTCSQIGQVPCGQWRGNSLFKSDYKNASQWPFQKRLHKNCGTGTHLPITRREEVPPLLWCNYIHRIGAPRYRSDGGYPGPALEW